jgi:hypothetical protein
MVMLYWVVPEKIHTPPTEEISAVRRGRGDKIVSDNSKCIRTSKGVGGSTSNFLHGDGMNVFWNDPFTIFCRDFLKILTTSNHIIFKTLHVR